MELAVGPAFKSREFFTDPPGVRLARGDNIGYGRLRWGEATRYWPRPMPSLGRYLLRAGDVLVGMDGSQVGRKFARVLEDDLPSLLVQRVARLRAVGELNQRYLLYVIASERFRNYVDAVRTGTSIPHISGAQILDFDFPLPPAEVQSLIADMLGALDDKIELNRRISQMLDEIAQALFKSWFVDFDPVRSKMNGAQPFGLDAETARLFPSSFEESTAGVLPSGWKWGSIADIAAYVNGRNFTKDATGFGRMVIRIAELNSGPGSSTVFNDVEAELVNIAQPDDILFAWSGSLGVYRWHRDEALINQHIFKVVCDEFPQWFVFYQLQASMEYFREIASHKATTMGHIKRGHLAEVALQLPPSELLAATSRILDPYYRQIHVLKRESQTLADLRDTLIPKLISGEIRIKDAERMAEVAGGS